MKEQMVMHIHEIDEGITAFECCIGNLPYSNNESANMFTIENAVKKMNVFDL